MFSKRSCLHLNYTLSINLPKMHAMCIHGRKCKINIYPWMNLPRTGFKYFSLLLIHLSLKILTSNRTYSYWIFSKYHSMVQNVMDKWKSSFISHKFNNRNVLINENHHLVASLIIFTMTVLICNDHLTGPRNFITILWEAICKASMTLKYIYLSFCIPEIYNHIKRNK